MQGVGEMGTARDSSKVKTTNLDGRKRFVDLSPRQKARRRAERKIDKRSGGIRASWVKEQLRLFYKAQEEGATFKIGCRIITEPSQIDGYEEYAKGIGQFEMQKMRIEDVNALRKSMGQEPLKEETEEEKNAREKKERLESITEQFKEIYDDNNHMTLEERIHKEEELVMQHPDVFREIFKSSFIKFIAFFHRQIHYSTFQFGKHHLDICKALSDRVLRADKLDKPNLMINMPPRAGKTQIVKYFCAWGFTHNPSSNFITTASDDKLVRKMSDEVKAILENEIYQTLFGVKLSKNNKSVELWNTDKNGSFRAATLRGGITGHGAGVLEDKFGGALIIDDMLKAQEAESITANEEVEEIYKSTLKSRLNNKSGNWKTPIIIIAQRLSVMDLCAYIKENERDDFDILELKALDENDKSYWENRISSEELIKMRQTNPFLFYAQYMQEPIVRGGNIIKREWFDYFHYKDLPEFKKVFMCADTALTTGKFSDFSAIGLFGVSYNNRIYFLDLLHLKEEQEILKQKINEFWNLHSRNKFWKGADLSCIVIEKRGNGISLIQDLKRMGAPVREITSPSSKGQRAVECAEYFINKYFLLPENEANPISRTFLNEACMFSEENKNVKTIHDDVFDMAMYAVQFGLMRRNGLF